MTDINVNVRSADEPKFAGNISIPHKKGVSKSEALSSDAIEQSTTAYQEDRVPAADYPELGDIRTNVSSDPPKTTPDSAKGTFGDNLKNALLNLTNKQFAVVQQAFPNITTNDEALKLLVFAWSHPGIPMDPQVQKLLNQMVQNAKQQTIKTLNLPADWSPPSPDTARSDQRLAEFQDTKFAQYAHQLADSPEDAETLTAAYYHPETAGELSSDLKTLLAQCEKAANSETQQEFGLPKGHNPPKDKLQYDMKLAAGLSELFSQELNESKEASNLTPNQKAQLKTLHSDPEAQVEDKEQLESLLKKLNAQAKNKLSQKFNLPQNLKVMSNKEQYYVNIKGNFLANFEENVNSQTSPPLTAAQKELLLATGGMQAGNLPPDLKALFSKIKNETVAEIRERYGLSKDWEPKFKTSETKAKKTEQKEGSKKSEASTEETDDAWDSVSGFSMKGQRSVKAATEKLDLEDISDPPAPDVGLQKNVLNHFTEYTQNLNTFVNQFLNLDEVMRAGSNILIVHLALDGLRNSIYAVQKMDSDLQTKSALMQKEVTQMKILKQRQELADMRKQESEHPKECFIFKVFDIILPVPVLNDIVEDFVKTFSYILDMMMGGLMNTIFTAAGSEPPGENPLAMMGVDKSITDNIDMAVGIIVAVVMLVIEVVLSTLVAQPELIALSIAEFSATLSAEAATIAVRVALRAAEEAIAEAAAKTAGQLTEKAAQEIMEEAITESLKESATVAMKQSTREAINEAAPETAQILAKQQGKNILKGAEKILEKQGTKLVVTESKQGLKETITKGVEEAADQVKARAQQILSRMRKLLKMAEDESQQDGKVFLKQTRKAQGRNSVVGKIVQKLDLVMQVHNQLQLVFQTVQSFLQFYMNMKKSTVSNEIAELESEIETLDATLQVLKRGMTLLQNALQDAAAWISDVNKQESGLYQKLQIHFVAA